MLRDITFQKISLALQKKKKKNQLAVTVRSTSCPKYRPLKMTPLLVTIATPFSAGIGLYLSITTQPKDSITTADSDSTLGFDID